MMPWWSLASFGALLAFCALTLLIVLRNPRSSLNWSCALFALSLAVWSFEDVFHGNPLTPLATARLATGIGDLGRVGFVSALLWFALTLTRRGSVLRSWWSYPLLFLPPVVFALALRAGAFHPAYVHHPFGWVVVWPTTAWPLAYYAYFLSYVAAAYVMFVRFLTTAQARERRQVLPVLVTLAVSALLGTFTDVVMPNLLGISFPELGSFFALIWAAGTYVGITRYGLMTLTPQAAAEDILAAMHNAVLLTSPAGEVVVCNRAGLELSGYTTPELEGRPAETLFADKPRFAAALASVASSRAPVTATFELLAKDGRRIPVNVSARAMADSTGAPAGVVWILRDLSERRRSEQALRDSEDRYRSFVQSFQGVVFRGDLDFHIEFLHGTVAAITGYTEQEFESGAVQWRKLIHPDDVARLRPGTERLRTVPDSSASREYRIVRKDGAVAWVREVIQNVSDESGRPAWLNGAVFDVSEHHRALEELTALSQLRESIIDSASMMMAVIGADMKVRVWNRAAELVTGYRRADAAGSDGIWARLWPDRREFERVRQRTESLIRQGQTVENVENTITSADGRPVTLDFSFRPLVRPDGTVDGFFVLARDVTEQRRAEQSLRESEEKYRSLVERSHDGIAILQDGIIRFANAGLLEMSGEPAERVVGSNFLDWIASDERAKVAERYRNRIAGGHPPADYETVLVLTDGRRVDIEVSGGVITYEGRPADMAAIRDISDRRRAEREQARHLRDTSFLARTAMELAELPPEADIYGVMARELRDLIDAQIVFISAYQQALRTLDICATADREGAAARVTAILGRQPADLDLKMPPAVLEALATSRLIELPGGIAELTLGQVPAETCRSLERASAAGPVYVIGFAWKGRLHGSASIIMPEGVKVEDPAVVEAFVRQATIALQRRRAEEALHEARELYRAAAAPGAGNPARPRGPGAGPASA